MTGRNARELAGSTLLRVEGSRADRGRKRDPEGRGPRGPRRARCTRSWGRTAPASARSPACSPGARPTRSPAAASTYAGQDLLALAPEERAAAGVFLGFQYPVEIPGVGNLYFLRTALNAIRQHARRGGARRDGLPRARQGEDEARRARPRASAAARSTRASPAARRSATRSSRWRCSSRASPSSTRSTPASTSTRCASSPTASTRCAAPDRAILARHPLPAAARLHRARLRARAWRTAASSAPAARSSRSSSSRPATPGSDGMRPEVAPTAGA